MFEYVDYWLLLIGSGNPCLMHRKGLSITILPNRRLQNRLWFSEPTCPHLYRIYFTLFFFYWSIIALQCFVSFCCATVICIHISPPSSASLPSILTPVLPVITELWAELPVPYSSFPLAVCFTRGSVYMSFVLYRISILDMGSQLVWELLYCTEEAEQGEAVQYSG